MQLDILVGCHDTFFFYMLGVPFCASQLEANIPSELMNEERIHKTTTKIGKVRGQRNSYGI